MKQLGRRLIAFNAPDLLTIKEQDAFDAYLKNKWTSDEETELTTIKNIKEQLDKLRDEGCNEALLEELSSFYKKRLEDQNCIFEA